MPARSKAQQKAARTAFAAKRGVIDPSKLAETSQQTQGAMAEEKVDELASKDVEQLPVKPAKESKEPAKVKEVAGETLETAMKKTISKGRRRPAKKAAKKTLKKAAKKQRRRQQKREQKVRRKLGRKSGAQKRRR